MTLCHGLTLYIIFAEIHLFQAFYKIAQPLGSMAFRIYEFVPVQLGSGMEHHQLKL